MVSPEKFISGKKQEYPRSDISFFPEEKLIELKKELGELKTPEYQGSSFAETHYQFGKDQKEGIRRNFAQRIEKKYEENPTHEEFIKKLSQTERCRKFMRSKLEDKNIDPEIRQTLKEYFDSLNEWARGAELETLLEKYKIKDLIVEGNKIDTELLALFFQNDVVGCQTFMTRGKKGEVYILHTEEDDENRVREAKFATFKVKDKTGEETVHQAFCYPELLPGSAFNYTKDRFVACDFLYIKPSPEIEKTGGSLANTAVWVYWRLAGKKSIEKIANALGPFLDGYAVNTVEVKNGKVRGENFIFVGDLKEKRSLGKEKNELLSQVNIFQDKDSEIAKKFENFPKPEFISREAYEHRLDLISHRVGRVFEKFGDKFELKDLREILTYPAVLEKYSSLPMASPWTKANIASEIKPDGKFKAYFGSGPAMDIFQDYIIFTNTKDRRELKGGWLK